MHESEINVLAVSIRGSKNKYIYFFKITDFEFRELIEPQTTHIRTPRTTVQKITFLANRQTALSSALRRRNAQGNAFLH